MTKYFLSLGILLFAFGVADLTAYAQDKACKLKFNVYEFKGDGTSEQFPVQGSKIDLIKDNETSGKFNVTVAKDGYQTTVKKFALDCNLADSQNKLTEIVFLWKGDASQVMTMPDVIAPPIKGKRDKDFPDFEVINKKAVSLARPNYPTTIQKPGGTIFVTVQLNELGYVMSAKPLGGSSAFQAAAVEAAKKSRFSQTLLKGIPVKVIGFISYDFVP